MYIYFKQQMSKSVSLSALILAILIALASCQNMNNAGASPNPVLAYDATEGAMSRHIYSTLIQLASSTLAAPNITLTATLPTGIFDDNQQINAASGLVLIEGSPGNGISPLTDKQLYLRVKSIVVNSGRTSFNMTLQFNRPAEYAPSTYTKLGFHVIFMGSNFNKNAPQWQVSSAPLAGGFVRNSDLVAVTQAVSGVSISQFNFTGTNGQVSPFAYMPGSTTGCGLNKVSGVYQIEIQTCDKYIFLPVLTGFAHEYNTGTVTTGTVTTSDVSIQSILVKDTTVTATTVSPALSTVQTNSSDPDYVFRNGTGDADYGLYIRFTEGTASKTVRKLQFGLVFIALRNYDTGYPTQNLYKDDFVVAVGVYGQPYTANDLTGTANNLYDALLSTTSTNVELNTNPYYKDMKMGHMFCGLQQLQFSDTALNLVLNGFRDVSVVNSPKEFIKASTTAYSDAVTEGSIGCVLLATSAAPCTSTETVLPYDTTKYVNTTSSAAYTLSILNSPDSLPRVASTTGYPNLYQFQLLNINDLATSTQIKMTYINIPPTQTQFIYYIAFDSNTLPATGQISYALKIGDTVWPTVNVDADPKKDTYIFHVPAGTTTIPVTLSITTADISPPATEAANTTIYTGLKYYTNVLTPGVVCVTGCVQKSGFTTGVDITTTPPTCIYCSADLNQVYKDGVCVCKDYFYNSAAAGAPLDCKPCTKTLCTECSVSSCTVCVPNATLATAGIYNNSCVCDDGFYQSGSVCLPCPVGCSRCSSPTDCLACANSTYLNGTTTRYGISQNCACLPGLFQMSNTAFCLPCSAPCVTCSGSATFCTSCPSTLTLNITTGVCACPAGTFSLNDQCVRCSPLCSTCSISSIYCVTCAANAQPAGTDNPNFKTCECVLPYVQIQGACVDSTCSTITPNCGTCATYPSTNTKFCIGCLGNRQLSEGQCVCMPGFYGNNCLACGSGCQVCSNQSVCLTCATGAFNNNNGTCSCQTGQYLTNLNQGYYCMACSPNCYTCATDSTRCTSCKAGFELNPTFACVCVSGTYPSRDGSQCLPCTLHCNRCVSATNCTACEVGFTFDSATFQCALSCSVGTYDAGSVCSACPTGCTACTNQYVCTSCAAGLVLYAGSCRAACPETTFALNGICTLCPAECSACSSLTGCSNCRTGYILFNGQCVTTCPDNTYLSSGSCLACNSTCASCSGSANTCTSCPSPYVLYNSVCYAQCPVATVANICTNQCPSGTYLSGTQCLSCDPTCASCAVVANNCTRCTNSYSYNGQCVNFCPDGTYYGTGFCGLCDISCRTCSNLPQNCTSCQNNYYRLGNNCVRQCGDGFYINNQQVCTPCGTGCKACTASVCTQCYDSTLTPVGQSCQNVCPTGANNINGKCICTLGVLYNNGCISSCPDGFYVSVDRTCERCAWPCLTCASTAGSCSTCVAGFAYNAVSRQCIRVGNCEYGLQQVNGQCVRVCSSNQYYYQTGCVFQCPDKTRPTVYACIEYVNPTFCAFPQFRQGNTCVSRCDQGYWPNDITRTCDRCSSNCAQCFSQTFCLSCTFGFFLNYDQTQCLASQQCQPGQVQYNNICYGSCPIGTYQAQTSPTCVRACPARTYFDNNYCYSTCSTVYYTPDACVNTCPPNIQCTLTR